MGGESVNQHDSLWGVKEGKKPWGNAKDAGHVVESWGLAAMEMQGQMVSSVEASTLWKGVSVVLGSKIGGAVVPRAAARGYPRARAP